MGQASQRASDQRLIDTDGAGVSFSKLRRFLRERTTSCAICGIEEWRGQPVLLIVDHIDGNSENNSLANLRMVCSNCDAQLPTFKARNKGNGRAWRRDRYRAGKSY